MYGDRSQFERNLYGAGLLLPAVYIGFVIWVALSGVCLPWYDFTTDTWLPDGFVIEKF